MLKFARVALRLIVMAMLVIAVISLTYLAGFGAGANWSLDRPTMVFAEHLSELAGADPPTSGEKSLDEQFKVFWEAWRLIGSDFYGPLPSTRDRVYGAIRGALASLKDEHTTFLTPEQANLVKSDDLGTFEGIGASIRFDDKIGFPRIVHVYAEQPAAKAGLVSGDVILEVDGTSTQDMAVVDVITLIRGPKDSAVQLSILKDGATEPVEVAVVRGKIEIPVVDSKMLDNGIAYLQLTEFNSLATKKMKAALSEVLEQKPRGLILDLRGNPGGFLHVAVEIASQFVGEGIIVSERDREGKGEVFRAEPGGLATSPSLPLVVLVNPGSASAAEITAAAVQDSGRGILLGEHTFGKSSVQVPHRLGDGSELRVTIAKWFTPKGRQIESLKPDIEVKMTAEDLRQDRDPQLERAAEYLTSGQE